MINNTDDNNIERIKFVAVYIKYEFVLNEIRSADIRFFFSGVQSNDNTILSD